MKTKVLSIVCAFVFLLTLTACGGSSSEVQKSASEIADAIYNTQTFQDTLNAITVSTRQISQIPKFMSVVLFPPLKKSPYSKHRLPTQ